MRVVLPGKPQAKLQAVSTVQWEGKRIVIYITGNGIVILGGPQNIIQTIYLDQCESLSAVVVDANSGKIAACSSAEVYIYKPYGKDEGILKWSLQLTIQLPEAFQENISLSWGSEEQLLAGSTSLNLYQTVQTAQQIWTQRLPKPAKIAAFSSNASLIASTGWYDRLIKIWRRQSFDADDTRFDFTYLAHHSTVTAVYWRTPPPHEHRHHEHNVDDVLYSTCADGNIRIWSATDPHGVSHMQLWAQIDMYECLQPRQLVAGEAQSSRYVFFVNNRDFSEAASEALCTARRIAEREDHPLEHLADIAKAEPDLCVVLDEHGNMSAWGFKSVGCRTRHESDIFNIAHVQDLDLSIMQERGSANDYNVLFLCFVLGNSSSTLSVITHHFDGRIFWHDAKVDEFLDPSPRRERSCSKALWTGHESPVSNLVREFSGRALLSLAHNNEVLLWRRDQRAGQSLLPRQSTLECNSPIYLSCILEQGRFVVALHSNRISLWDTTQSSAVLSSSCELSGGGEYLCLLLLPSPKSNLDKHYIAAITSNTGGIVWELNLCAPGDTQATKGQEERPSLAEFCSFKTVIEDDLIFMLPVDSAGSASSRRSLDSFANEVAVSCSAKGAVYTWAANVNIGNSQVIWRLMSTVRTGITNPSLISCSSTHKLAMIDSHRLGLAIWDTRTSQMEAKQSLGPLEVVQDLDWTQTPDFHALLAVGFSYKVTIMAQMRYNYMSGTPAWAPIREIHTKELTSHPIADSAWLNNGDLVIGAGNQLYVCSEEASTTDEMIVDLRVPIHGKSAAGLLDLTSYLNGPLPVYHPHILGQSMLAGHISFASNVILALHKIMKYFAPGDELDSYLSLPLESFYCQSPPKEASAVGAKFVDGDEPEELTEEVATSLTEMLSKLALPQVTSPEQLHLVEAIECLSLVGKEKRTMDENAMRYYFFFSQHILRKRQSSDDISILWREFVWAFHSNSQHLLVDHISRQLRGRLLWGQARVCGMFMWLTDHNALQAQFEVVARNEYTKTEEKNPIDCSLYYLALRKKSVLLGLWRMVTWNPEQAGTQRLLKNNFAEARWKTAALKNAYALMGKRRFEYAAAWFLLADNLQDAVNICINQMGDLQLGIAVARVYDGDSSPVFRSLLQDRVLPLAAMEGNRWQATWAFYMLGQQDMAIKALIEPLHDLITVKQPPKPKARSYLSHDPARILLYMQLRDKSLSSKGVSPISPRAEWDFVINTARTYDRMGCDLLALDLVRNWKFLPPLSKKAAPTVDIKRGRRKSGRRRSSGNVPTTPKSPTMEKPKPTMFKEPDASSLLDSFGL